MAMHRQLLRREAVSAFLAAGLGIAQMFDVQREALGRVFGALIHSMAMSESTLRKT